MRALLTRMQASAMTILLAVGAWMQTPLHMGRSMANSTMRRCDSGAIGLGGVMAVVGGVITFVVVLLVLSVFAPTMFGSVASINENITNESTGSTEVDTLKPVFIILIAIGFLLALVTAVLGTASLIKGVNK